VLRDAPEGGAGPGVFAAAAAVGAPGVCCCWSLERERDGKGERGKCECLEEVEDKERKTAVSVVAGRFRKNEEHTSATTGRPEAQSRALSLSSSLLTPGLRDTRVAVRESRNADGERERKTGRARGIENERRNSSRGISFAGGATLLLLLLSLFRAQRRALRALATMMATHLHGVLLEEEEKEEVTRKRKRARRGTKRRGKLKVICKKTRQFFDLSSFSSFHPLSLSLTLSLSLSLSLLSLSLLFFPVSPSSNRHPAAAQRPRDRIQKRVVSRQRQ
jgi:hypothetical protein